jgi:hypothetical protein
MEFQLPISLGSLARPIRYTDKIMLTGSCFTEHIGDALRDWKFDTLQNPNGILFDASSVASSLISYIEPRQYGPDDLIYLNELWQSWQHHSIFSGVDQSEVLRGINGSQRRAHAFLKEADWLIITLGSAFSYRLADGGTAVANCHRAPGKSFVKHLMTIEEIQTALDTCLYQLFYFNRKVRVIFTVSPVRHIRDGVVENNRSKARLLESVHHLVGKFHRLHYFPAYELVIDVLRDYRFFDVDMVHPNYPATQFVLEKFTEFGIDPTARPLMEELKKLTTARRHRPMHPSTAAHAQFMRSNYEKAAALTAQYPFLNLSEEMAYFGAGLTDG